MPHSLKNYAMKVVHLDGRPIDWRNPPAADAMVMWTKRTTGGKSIRGSFRTICAMDRLNRLCYRRWGVGLQVIQACYNTGVAASAGTHDRDACFDLWIPGVDPWVSQRFLRRNGFGCWVRMPPLFGWHIHGFVLPVPEGQSRSDDFKVGGFEVGVYVDGGYSTRGRLVTSSQIQDYYSHAFGLSGRHSANSDRSWYPKNIGTTVFKLQSYIDNRVKEMKPKPKPQPAPKPPALQNGSEKIKVNITTEDRPVKVPSQGLKSWRGFYHMLARFYQNYEQAVLKAARSKHKAVDVDAQPSKQKTGWAFHWATLGRLKLRDPKGQYGKNTRVDSLTDAEIDRLRGPKGEKPNRLATILRYAYERGVRVEIEAKAVFDKAYTDELMSLDYVQEMHKRGDLQVKTLASMGAPNGPVQRLRPWHESGFTTMMSFSTWGRRKGGISKKAAWPVTDYVRGSAKWVA